MSTIEIRKISITALDTDAIVNAANDDLLAGGGVCGAVFKAAGYEQLQEACRKIGHCDTGSAVITPGFNLKAKFIIHAVGPVWSDGTHGEPKLLYGAYRRSLELASENGCSSIGFPLISAGIFGYPIDPAWRKAIQACRDFLEAGKQIDIVFAVLDDTILASGQNMLQNIAPQFAAKGDAHAVHPMIKENAKNTLRISGTEKAAVFFHKPEEPFGYLSNWYLSPFDLDGIHFTSTEQYIMYRKCMTFGDETSAKAILETEDTAMQQAIGQKASGYIDSVWAGMRQMVAFRALMSKFSQNENLKQKLLDTGDAYLVECAGSDKVWACGVRLDDDKRFDAANWTGDNILGFALMEVREVLKKSEHGTEK